MPGQITLNLLKVVVASGVPFASISLSHHANPPRQVEVVESPSLIEVEDPTTQFPKSSDGGFYAVAVADKMPVRMLIDSGANITVISARDADSLGIAPAPSQFRERLATAGGTVPIALVRVKRLMVANHEFHDLRVAIASDKNTPSLLGSDVLSRFRRVSIAGDVLQLSS